MTYLRRSNPSGKRSFAKTASIVILLVFLFALHFFFPRFYPTIFYPVTSLVWKSENSFTGWLSSMGSMVRSKYGLILENQELVRQIRANEASLLILQSLEQENMDLKSMLDRKPEGDIVLSVVLTRPPVSPYDTLIIDRGSRDGISVGDRVYADGNILVGEIAEVYGRESKVSFFSTPGKRTAISFVGSNIHTEATGRGGGNFTASVPVEAGIQEGDTIIIPDIKNHTFGVVESIQTDSSDSFGVILFKSPINIHDVKFVEVSTR